MSIEDVCALVWSAPVAGALFCRVNLLRFGRHDARAVLMHWGLFVAALYAGVNAWTGDANLQDIAVLLACSAWILLSLKTWAGGEVPSHITKPAPLGEPELEQYVGGRSE